MPVFKSWFEYMTYTIFKGLEYISHTPRYSFEITSLLQIGSKYDRLECEKENPNKPEDKQSCQILSYFAY
mgnify:CR=1 FL=1